MNSRILTQLFCILLIVWTSQGCGRKKSCKPRDTTRPDITCPRDIERSADPGQVNAWITWDKPTVVDNVDGTNIRAYPCGRGPNERYSGTNYITYRAKDKAGNVNKCTFKVKVTVVYCDPPKSVNHGYYHFFPSNDFRYGGRATYGCYKGYERIGKQVLECRIDGTWSSSAPTCQGIRCPPIRNIDHGTVSCTDSNRYRSECTYTCESGYRIRDGQSRVRVCGHYKKWLGRQPSCVDIEPPVFGGCPKSKIAYTDKGKDTSRVRWITPYATDNSDETPRVILTEGKEDVPYAVGSHKIVYTAVDRAGNKAKPCQFTVSVRRLMCHTIYPTPSLMVTCEEGFGYGASCQFSCQNNDYLKGESEVTCMTYGKKYLVRWSWGTGQPICEGESCPLLEPPENGALACDNWLYGSYCKMFCNSDYTVPRTKFELAKSMFICGHNGIWNNRNEFKVPGCSKTRRAKGFSAGFELHFFSGDCCDENVAAEIAEKFIKFFNEIQEKGIQAKCKRFEAECHVGNVRVTCGQDQCNPFNRRKRNADTYDLDVEGTLYYDPPDDQSSTADMDYEAAKEAMNELGTSLGDVNVTLSINETLEFKSLKIYNIEQECEEGLQPSPYGVGCVGCESGSFFSLELEECEFCPIGTYNSGTQITECVSCPPYTTTSSTGSKSPDDCIDYCLPGKYSTYGTVPCTPCAVGSYSDQKQATYCHNCPAGMTTSSEKSTSSEDCHTYSITIVPSANGSFGVIENAFQNVTQLSISLKVLVSSSTFPLPVVSIEDDNEQILSLVLGDNIFINVTGIETNISGTHLLNENWNTFLIQLSSDTLPSLKIYVNGIAHEETIQVDLEKVSPSTRVLVGSQYDPNETFEVTDLNIWSTVSEDEMITNATNECSITHYGDIISWNDIPILMELNDAFLKVPAPCDVSDDCLTQPCGNSTCVDGINAFTCICDAGYTGDLCDMNIDDCVFHACDNSAICIDGIDNYSCACTSEFRGQYCELEIVNGGWGEWSEWSLCSKSCNNGTQSRARSCDQPLPGPDGEPCSGDNTEVQSCNVVECPTCAKLEHPENGYVLCDYIDSTDMNNCTQHCDDGYAFAFEALNYYVCGYETGYQWNNVTRLQCTEIQAPSEITVEHGITYNMPCTEETIRAVEETVASNLEEISCLQSGLCALIRVDIMGNGCPIHVPDMDHITVEMVWSIVAPENALEASVTGQFRVKVVSRAVTKTTFANDYYIYEVRPIFCSKTCEDMTSIVVRMIYNDLCKGLDVISKLSDPANELAEALTTLYYLIETGNFTITSDGREHGVLAQSVEPLISCHSTGYIWIDYYCVPCQIGTYGEDYTCYECPVGAYQNLTGQDSCTKCPLGLATVSVGSTKLEQCNVPPSEDDVCKSFNMDSTDLDVGWLCGETLVSVSRQYLVAEHFTDVFPVVTVYTDNNNILIECLISDSECVTTVDESDLNPVNTYIIKGSVPASDVTCTKTLTITYQGLSSNGVVLVVFLVLIVSAIIIAGTVAGILMFRSRKKTMPTKDNNPSQRTLERMAKYKL